MSSTNFVPTQFVALLLFCVTLYFEIELEELSGVKQPIIARMEAGKTNPQLDTIPKVLAPLGKTLAVVPLK
ncbi:MAG: helix-turn-helix domain-containing protein [Clostridia bacterium]|nr:helix-turn-helix domain-containing protein [Clostridia bacterium]